ncbi:hypothetical protein [Paenibacillus sp. DR312]|uniref:hypothetical protein n=1 Tax=unclassified Paenibacillus TaxID=185978 RepID=UPI001C975402|nr:hypothetical protein [Paenibacillus sp. DR312]QZN75210.1 hypothetical protein K5K90_28160 [Paenibacillus sp. DR312]
MFIVQILLAIALLGSSGSSNYATSTQLEINQIQPMDSSPEQVMETGLEPFRSERNYNGWEPELDQFEQAASNLQNKLYESVVSPILSKPGETGIFDYGGNLKLLKSVPLNTRFERGPLTIHIVHAQLLEASDIPEDSQKNISILNREDIGSKITYINILYTVENTTDQNIGFYGLNSVHPNTGKPISADRNFMRKSYVYNQYDGVVIDTTNYGLVYTDDPDKLESIELVFNRIYDYDTGETIVEPTSLNIPFTFQK